MTFGYVSIKSGGARVLSALRAFLTLAATCIAASAIAMAQSQAIPFFDDSTVQTINLSMAPADLAEVSV